MEICVFCSSSDGAPARLTAQGEALGRRLAERGHGVLYGGSSVGTMGAVARGARAGGGRVTGVLPTFLADRGIADADCDELVHTDDLLERKQVMLARSDGFVALPGGLGTLDELLEVVTHIHLGRLEAPVVLLDAGGFWGRLFDLLVDLEEQGLARAPGEVLEVEHDVDAAIDALETYAPRTPAAVWRA